MIYDIGECMYDKEVEGCQAAGGLAIAMCFLFNDTATTEIYTE